MRSRLCGPREVAKCEFLRPGINLLLLVMVVMMMIGRSIIVSVRIVMIMIIIHDVGGGALGWGWGGLMMMMMQLLVGWECMGAVTWQEGVAFGRLCWKAISAVVGLGLIY